MFPVVQVVRGSGPTSKGACCGAKQGGPRDIVGCKCSTESRGLFRGWLVTVREGRRQGRTDRCWRDDRSILGSSPSCTGGDELEIHAHAFLGSRAREPVVIVPLRSDGRAKHAKG